MGCGASSQTSVAEASSEQGCTTIDDRPESAETLLLEPSSPSYGLRPPMKNLKAPIAFEVPKTDGDGDVQPADSIIQAHPPRRLRRLEDEQINLTQEDVERRHALAEQRRQEALKMRAQSARLATAKGPRRQQLAPISNE